MKKVDFFKVLVDPNSNFNHKNTFYIFVKDVYPTSPDRIKSYVVIIKSATPDNFDPAGSEIRATNTLQFRKYHYVWKDRNKYLNYPLMRFLHAGTSTRSSNSLKNNCQWTIYCLLWLKAYECLGRSQIWPLLVSEETDPLHWETSMKSSTADLQDRSSSRKDRYERTRL